MDTERAKLHILRTVGAADALPIFYGGPEHRHEIILIVEMIDAGLLTGDPTRDERGIPDAVAITGITTAGRERADEIEARQTAMKPRAKVGRVLKTVGAWLAGIATVLLVQWLAGMLGS